MEDKINANPLVSVIIPNFNTINIIDSCLENIIKIDYKPLEIIIVDDFSSDGSYEKLLEFQKKDPRLVILRNEKNSGPSKTRNNGINNSKGKYIAFLETDMHASSTFLEPLVRNLENDSSLGAVQSLVLDLNKKNLIQHNGLYYDPYNFFVFQENIGDDVNKISSKLIEKYTSIGAVGSMVRKDLLDKIGGFDENIVHNIDDIDLGWRIWISGNKIKLIPESITYHWTNKKPSIREKTTSKINSEFYSHKTFWVFLKNYELKNLLWYTPWLYSTFLTRVILNLLKGDTSSLKGLWMSTVWLFKNFKKGLNERKRIQLFRKMSDKEIFSYIFMKGNILENFKKINHIKVTVNKVFK